SAVPAGPIAAVRRQLTGKRRCGRLLIPAPIVGKVERLSRRGRLRRKIEAAEDRSLLAQSAAREFACDSWNSELLQNAEQSRHGIGRDTRCLQSDGVGIEKRAQIVSASPELIREVVKRCILFDRASQQAADRDVAELLAERPSG